MVYDCFIFFNELDLLEIRLNELNDIVDKFKENIITFSKVPDPETKWQWVGRIKAEEDIILEKSMSIVNKLHPA